MASTVMVAWLLGAACCSTGDSCGISGSPVVGWGSVETEFWSLCLGLMKLLFLLKHPSSCWNLNHVGVGFFALFTYHSFFTLPRIKILEPYILSCLEWQCFNSILEILGIGIELAFFLRYEFSLLADHSSPVMVELRCWIEAFFQIEFILEMESHWRLECTCNLKVTDSKVDLVLQLFQLDSWIP